MTDRKHHPHFAVLRDLEESFHRHCRARAEEHAHHHAPHAGPRARRASAAWWTWKKRGSFKRGSFNRPIVRKIVYGTAAAACVAGLGVFGLWVRLASGPIALDIATPWLASAIEQNFGGRHKVEVGGTLIERDERGRASLRIRDIVVRDADGAVVASAPRAEVSLSGTNLLIGRLRATRVSLVGAELAVRIEQDGQVTVSTGSERRPIAVTPTIVRPAPSPGSATPMSPPATPGDAAAAAPDKFAALLNWIDKAIVRDDQGLGEIGLKNGSLSVDDQRTGKHWTFEQINFSVNRMRRGGVVFSLSSDNAERPWLLTASVTPSGYQRRQIQVEARRVSTKDLLLASRLDEGQFQSDIPLSGVVRAEIGPDSMPTVIEGRIIAETGLVGDPADPDGTFQIDRAEFSIDWDAARRSLLVPFQIVSGGNRITLLSQFEAPREPGAPWYATFTGGSILLSSGDRNEDPLVLNRIMLRASIDPANKRIALEQGEISGKDLSIALSGNVDGSGAEPRLAGGFAGTQMTTSAAKRIWPAFVAPKVRTWVLNHFQSGAVEHITIASNAPLDALKEGPRPIPDEGLSVEVVVSNAVIQPVDGLPPIREADLTTRITGRTATISVGRGTVELASGRKLTLTNGVFEIPDTLPQSPPARVRFRIDGSVQAAAELLALDKLRDTSGSLVDPTTSRGTVSGQVTMGLPIARDPAPGSTTYNVNLDLANFGADRMIMGQKLEAQALRVVATNQGYQIKGDVKINGTPAVLEYRKPKGEGEAEVRIAATLDEAARNRMGFDTGSMITGPVPMKFAGRVAGDKDARFAVEADLTPAKIDNLLPGWTKPAGKAARASFTVTNKPQSTRFDDLVVDGGGGAQVKGSLELESSGDLIAANFPIFALSDGDKTSLRADRGPDGALRVVMRGEVYDGRAFIKSILGGSNTDQKPKKQMEDVDLDIRAGAVVGFNGEALRGVELKMSRRGGNIRSLTLNSKIGRDTPLIGDLRGRSDQRGAGKQVIYIETADAGALLRFTDMYPRMTGGQMWVAMDPPTPDHAPQEGLMNIRDFSIRGEPALDRVAAQGANGVKSGVDFSRMRVEFTRAPGRVTFREGVVRGPTIGATMDGSIDYGKSEVHMRGTFVPLYGLNNAFGQIPIVGLFLGGSKEGLLGVTYEVVGTPGAPILRVNPISAVAPGLLRKFFEFPGERQPQDPGTIQTKNSDRFQ